MVALNYAPLCGCGNQLKIFKSGRIAKVCSEHSTRTQVRPQCRCGAPIEQPNGKGRTRKHCSPACRRKAKVEKSCVKGLREFSCLRCGKNFTTSHKRKYCSPRCHNQRSHGPRKLKPARACKGCGTMFVPRHSGNKGLYCSRSCAYEHRNQWTKVGPSNPAKPGPYCRVWFIVCKQCGKEWTAKRKKELCSRECALAFGRDVARAINKASYAAEVASRQPIACVECGESFTSTHGRKFCSDECSDRIYSNGFEFIKRRYGMSLNEWRRVRLAVLERDEYRCHICGGNTDPGSDVNDDDYPNADHVVPVSNGGETVMHNLRCAHRACNIKKSDKPNMRREYNSVSA